MGGNALKKVKTIRLEREQYLQYEREIVEIIRPLVTHLYIPRTFPGKESFGDLDLVYMTEDPEFLNKVINLFQSKDSFHNGDITSVEYKNFQVDFILSRPSYFENHCCFLDYNDFGGILGQMTSRYELKYGFDGLFLRVHRDHVREHHLGEVLLSANPDVIFQYLGLDGRRFKEVGFQTPLEMFDFLMECSYCSIISYAQENINTVHRRRLAHRPIYQQFIEYITTHPLTRSQPALPYLSPLSDHTTYLLNYFQCKEAYDDIIRRDEEIRSVKAKFNGGVITAVTGLEGKEIGQLILAMKEHVFLNLTPSKEERKLGASGGEEEGQQGQGQEEEEEQQGQEEGQEEPKTGKKAMEEEFHQHLLKLSEEDIVDLIKEVYQLTLEGKSSQDGLVAAVACEEGKGDER